MYVNCMLDLMMCIKCALNLRKDVLRLYQNDEQGLHYNVCKVYPYGIWDGTWMAQECHSVVVAIATVAHI
jgi:hypothetical protein